MAASPCSLLDLLESDMAYEVKCLRPLRPGKKDEMYKQWANTALSQAPCLFISALNPAFNCSCSRELH